MAEIKKLLPTALCALLLLAAAGARAELYINPDGFFLEPVLSLNGSFVPGHWVQAMSWITPPGKFAPDTVVNDGSWGLGAGLNFPVASFLSLGGSLGYSQEQVEHQYPYGIPTYLFNGSTVGYSIGAKFYSGFRQPLPANGDGAFNPDGPFGFPELGLTWYRNNSNETDSFNGQTTQTSNRIYDNFQIGLTLPLGWLSLSTSYSKNYSELYTIDRYKSAEITGYAGDLSEGYSLFARAYLEPLYVGGTLGTPRSPRGLEGQWDVGLGAGTSKFLGVTQSNSFSLDIGYIASPYCRLWIEGSANNSHSAPFHSGGGYTLIDDRQNLTSYTVSVGANIFFDAWRNDSPVAKAEVTAAGETEDGSKISDDRRKWIDGQMNALGAFSSRTDKAAQLYESHLISRQEYLKILQDIDDGKY